nr:prolyl oligopeptidase family serine peptidase [Ahniella affigens]
MELGLILALLSGMSGPSAAQYQQPPEPLLATMRLPEIPSPSLSPDRRTMLLVQQEAFPAITRLAEPYLKLAGLRIEPRGHNRHDMANGYGIRGCLAGLSLLDVASRQTKPVALPEGACVDWPIWSASGKYFAFANATPDGAELWVGDATTARTWQIEGIQLNPILDQDIKWIAGTHKLIVKAVPADLGAPAVRPAVPVGPEIKDATSGSGESGTYESRDTLASPQDEALFNHYATSELRAVDVVQGHSELVAAPAVYTDVSVAPDGVHVRVETLQQPYSYVTTWERFAHRVAIVDLNTKTQVRVADVPVADRVPPRGSPTGPRSFFWRANAPAELYWVEALDGGDWRHQVAARDRVMRLQAPFTGQAKELFRTTQRFGGMAWFAKGSETLLTEIDANRNWYQVRQFDVAKPSRPGKLLWELSWDDEYHDPGYPMFERLSNGASVLRRDGPHIFLSGTGASPDGDRPFLDRYNLRTGQTERLFRSSGDALERFADFIDGDSTHWFSWHQSPKDPPNIWIRTLGERLKNAAPNEAVYASTRQQVTNFADPAPLVRQIKKQLVTYQRKDGVALSFTLYTPPGYQPGERLPAILAAYPLDYAEAATAGQVRGSGQTFTRLGTYQLLLLAGYAVIDDASFPIVGDPQNAYDTYLQQLRDNAEAAVAKAVEMGVVDPDRIGVTGHSHGALMTANLLAHTDLFRAGVATSGGYNKTLTPFGFQNERRSFWKAPKAYDEASAFFHADKINEPLLIVHGSDDANPGTEVTQSPRLFQAIRGNGGTARLVMLPFEPHWYTARESNEHLVYEMLTWFDRYVKHAPPRTKHDEAVDADKQPQATQP